MTDREMAAVSPDDDPRVPGKSRRQEALFACLFGTVSIGLMGVLAALANAPFIFPSLGPTAFLIFHRPTASAACPRNTIIGHLIGAACGVFALVICGLWGAPNALDAGVDFARALAAGLSLGLTSGLMVLFRVGHPPAGATTLIVSLGLMSQPLHLLTLLIAVVVLVAQGHLIHLLATTRYPLWRPFPSDAS